MTEHVSPLRRRMIDDMAIRNMSPNTQKAYVRAVQNFSRHFMKGVARKALRSRSIATAPTFVAAAATASHRSQLPPPALKSP